MKFLVGALLQFRIYYDFEALWPQMFAVYWKVMFNWSLLVYGSLADHGIEFHGKKPKV